MSIMKLPDYLSLYRNFKSCALKSGTGILDKLVESDVTGVKIIHAIEGEAVDNFTKNPNIHTVIRFNIDTGSVSIAHRRPESTMVREFTDSNTFIPSLINTSIWDITFNYKNKTSEYSAILPTD